jgi:hypothetical protein
MKHSMLLVALLSASALFAEEITQPEVTSVQTATPVVVQTPAATPVVQAPVATPVVAQAPTPCCSAPMAQEEDLLTEQRDIRISVTGQGVAPTNTISPAQAYALAKRAAVADAYRLIAEKVKGVRVDGQDLIKDMMVKRSTVRTSVDAMVRNANIVETAFKEGLCEVEMEITLSHSQFAH